jgi:hypothetical protein
VAHALGRPPGRGQLTRARQGDAEPAVPTAHRGHPGLYVALREVGPNVGLTLSKWRRDEEAWEDWSTYPGPGRLRPDAYTEVHLDVDGTEGPAGAFIEVDFATMDQARLRAKVARHRRYCTETIWWDRHPCCPALLLVTTSEARVNHFLAAVERDRPRPSLYEHENPAHYDELVAACAAVTSPEEAVIGPVWRAAVADTPVTLAQLLDPELRQYRRVVARVDAARQADADRYRRARVHDLAQEVEAVADALGDLEAAAAVHSLLGPRRGFAGREEWAVGHPALADATLAWWAATKAGDTWGAPRDLQAAWRTLAREYWLAQDDVLLGDNEAVRLADPRLSEPAATLAAGGLVEERDLWPSQVIDGRVAFEAALTEHEERRERAVAAQLHALPLHRRLRTDRTDLDAAYDAEHLYVCTSCALPRNDDDPGGRGLHAARCACCGQPLVPLAYDPDLPPPLEDSLDRIAARRQQLRSRR